MNTQNLKQMEKNLWKLNFEDGIMDISMGLIIIITAICQKFYHQRFVLYMLYFLPMITAYILNQKFVIPRKGIVNYSKKRKQNKQFATMSILILIWIGFILTAFGILSPVKTFSMYAIAFFIILIISLAAFFFDLYRILFYGFFISIAFLTSEYLIRQSAQISDGSIAWLVAGVVITLCGTLIFIKFLKKYKVYND